jgi:hypothetical protein
MLWHCRYLCLLAPESRPGAQPPVLSPHQVIVTGFARQVHQEEIRLAQDVFGVAGAVKLMPDLGETMLCGPLPVRGYAEPVTVWRRRSSPPLHARSRRRTGSNENGDRVSPLAAVDNPQRVATQWPLQFEGLESVCCEPSRLPGVARIELPL